ncbi:MAG: ribonuclease R family protein [Cyanobacteria bacterium P01_F01_bin.33]
MEPIVEKGTLVEFRLDGDRKLGVVQGTEGKKHLILASATGQTHKIHPRQITFVIAEQQARTPADITPFWQQVEVNLDPEHLAIAWELLSEEPQPMAPDELAEMIFSSHAPAATYAVFRLLSDDRQYFKRKGDAFEPRSRVQVEEIQHQLAVTERKEREKAEFEAKLDKALHQGEAVEWSPGERLRLESLERLALFDDEASDRQQAIALLQRLQQPTSARGALDTLVALGVWAEHENLALRRHQIPTAFPAEVKAAAIACLDEPPPDTAKRKDLIHLKTYTIDDASTCEIDDGLSVEPLSDGRQCLWIHIADPTRWLTPGDEIESEARRRGTSLYLPDRLIPMLPLELAAGPMSLRQGQTSCALSFGVVLDETGAIADVQVCASYIRVTYRLTYEEADELLELGVEPELSEIAAAGQLRYQWRLQQGAISIGLPEQSIKLAETEAGSQLDISKIEETPSRQLVSELMVLTGAAAAHFATDNDLPVPYRFQVAPDLPSDEVLAGFAPGPVRSFAIMRYMKRGEIGLTPSRHGGLGLEAYSQATSPIRRYSDLLVHFQLKAFLAGAPLPFTPQQVQEAIASLGTITYTATQIERHANRYWTLEYLKRSGAINWHGQVLGYLREMDNLVMVLLDDIAFRVPVYLQRHAEPGEWLELELVTVNPRADEVVFKETTTSVEM